MKKILLLFLVSFVAPLSVMADGYKIAKPAQYVSDTAGVLSEGSLPDITAKRIIADKITPFFEKQQWE